MFVINKINDVISIRLMLDAFLINLQIGGQILGIQNIYMYITFNFDSVVS